MLCQMSLKRSTQQPVIIVMEDLHWIDQSSEDFLMALVENLSTLPSSCLRRIVLDINLRGLASRMSRR